MGLDLLDVQIAELTPTGAGGVSVLGLAGPDVLGLLRLWGVGKPEVGQLKFCRLTIQGEVLDEALVCVKGVELAEVHVHGSRPLVRRLCEQPVGGRSAPGQGALELSIRSALATAPCELAGRILLDQLEGAFVGECARLAGLDADEMRLGLLAWAKHSMELRWAFEPARILIAGPVNAGKSTLFNAIVGDERAITSDVEGTTRDLISESAMLGDWPVVLLDSAGQREVLDLAGQGLVERAGQRLARERASHVDWVLWLVPGADEVQPGVPAGVESCVLRTCRDLPGGDPLGISARLDPKQAVERVEAHFREALGLPAKPWVPGAAVAFDAKTRAWLEGLLELEPGDARRALNACAEDQGGAFPPTLGTDTEDSSVKD